MNIIRLLKTNQNKIFVFLLLIFIFHFLFRVYEYRNEYFSKYDSSYWRERYLNSQWVKTPGCGDSDPHINPKTCVWDDQWYLKHGNKETVQDRIIPIGDDGLYAYAGWEYINGKDPTLLNAEMPPFGKYLIGLSILIFKNQNIFALFSGILVLLSFFLLDIQLFKNKLFAFLPVFLFSFEPLFYTQLRAPFLDLLYLSFLLWTFLFLLKRQFIPGVILLGLMMSTKASFGTFATVSGSLIIYFFLSKNFQSLKKMLFFLPISFFIFALTYLRFFWLGHSIREFFGVQKWILNFYYVGAKGSFGSVFQMLFLGRWETWWSKPTSVNEWNIFWPIIFLLSMLAFIFIIKQKKFNNFLLFIVWVFIYLLFLSTLPVFPRYLLLVLPFLYSLSIYFLFNLDNQFRSKKQN